MKMILDKKNDIMEINISGRLDAVTAVEADKTFSVVIDEGESNLLINLAELDYISSAGLRVLLVVAKRIQQNRGKVVLCDLNANVKEIFEISGFSSIFNIFDSKEEAVKSFETQD